MTVEIYTKPNCPYCVKAKHLLNQKGISYKEFTIGGAGASKEDIQARITRMGLSHQVRTVPQIFYKNKDELWVYIGGYTELAARPQILDT